MRKSRKLCAALAVALAFAVTAPLVSDSVGVDAAKKPTLSKTKLTIKVGQSKKLSVKNYKKKVTWKTSKSSVVKLSSKKKTSVKLTGKKKGSANVTCKVKVGKKNVTLKCKVKVKSSAPVVTEAPAVVPTPLAPTAAPTAVPTEGPTPSPTPFNYDTYDACLWKTPYTFKEAFKDDFMSGVAVGGADLYHGEFSSLVRYHYNSVTMGNEHKMENFFSESGDCEMKCVDSFYKGDKTPVLDFTTLEKTLKYCKENGLKVRFHTFVWHSQVQPWFFLADYNWSSYDEEEYEANGWDTNNYHRLADAETMKFRLNSFVTQVIDYIYKNGYGDTVYAYDVVNEATNGNLTYEYDENATYDDPDSMMKQSSRGQNTYSGGIYGIKINGGVTTKSGKSVTVESSPSDVEDMVAHEGRTPDYSHSYWHATMGVNYLYWVFSDVYNAIKDAKAKYGAQYNYTVEPSLIYNDYSSGATNTEIGLIKWINAACNMANNTEGIMYCTGVGVQSHDYVGNNDEQMIKTYVDAGFEVQVTELDVGCNSGGNINYKGQAETYKGLYKTYLKYSKNSEYCKTNNLPGVTSVTQWGIRDGDGSWRSNEAPYLYEPYDGDDENLNVQPKPSFYAVFQAAGIECGDEVY